MEVDPSGRTSMVDTSDILCSIKGCTAKVYRDDNHPDLKFLYCSQQCRDTILCDNQKMLNKGCRDLEKISRVLLQANSRSIRARPQAYSEGINAV